MFGTVLHCHFLWEETSAKTAVIVQDQSLNRHVFGCFGYDQTQAVIFSHCPGGMAVPHTIKPHCVRNVMIHILL